MASYGPRKPSRVELNYQVLDKVQQAVAKGVLAWGVEIAREAESMAAISEDERWGHVKDRWGVSVFAYGKKVGDVSGDGSAVAKPREFRSDKLGINGVVGFGFPGRFLELGTSDTRAQPFLTPASQRVNAEEAIVTGSRPYWPR